MLASVALASAAIIGGVISRSEYLARAAAEDDWAPGWLAIDSAFDALYPGVAPAHFGTAVPSRALFGGNEYLDGFSLYPSPNGYQHAVTYGMSSLYVDEDAYGGELSGWGYEMTMKIRADDPDDCQWAINSLANLARYTYTTQRWLEPYQILSGRGEPLRREGSTLLTSYVMVPDTEVPGIETVHGRVDFIQLVGLLQAELDWIAGTSRDGAGERAEALVQRMVEGDNPHLVTDLARTRSFV